MAKAYKGLKRYSDAIKCLKKLLQLAWLIGESLGESYELKAYEGFAI